MKERELRRSMAVLPIGTVMKLTDLSARQIRYYEEQELIFPERSDGNRRMYSLNDIDALLILLIYCKKAIILRISRKFMQKRMLKSSNFIYRRSPPCT